MGFGVDDNTISGVNLRFVVVGAGMAGLLSAIKLREAGFTDITVYEKADRLGGTWRENTYPGIACDVPSHLYTYSFAPNPDWSHVFSPGPEILGYLEAVADRHGVAGLVRYGTEVCRLEYDGSGWRIELSTGERDEADVVIAATGVLHHPRYPDIDGLDEFAGPLFHSARWDHDAPLSGARLGVIRHRVVGRADHRRARRRRRRTASVPAHPAVGPRGRQPAHNRRRPRPLSRRPDLVGGAA
jgi:cation diffusion facilitator CzcD-associated flavoprotein CzcO